MNLLKTFRHQSSVIDVNISILIRLFLENLFTTDRSHTIDWINQVPNLIVVDGFYFGLSGFKLFLRVGSHHCFDVSHRLIIAQQ
jgi:hypothetical protein